MFIFIIFPLTFNFFFFKLLYFFLFILTIQYLFIFSIHYFVLSLFLTCAAISLAPRFLTSTNWKLSMAAISKPAFLFDCASGVVPATMEEGSPGISLKNHRVIKRCELLKNAIPIMGLNMTMVRRQ